MIDSIRLGRSFSFEKVTTKLKRPPNCVIIPVIGTGILLSGDALFIYLIWPHSFCGQVMIRALAGRQATKVPDTLSIGSHTLDWCAAD